MIQHHQNGAEGFTIDVKVSSSSAPPLTILEKLAQRLGTPDRVIRLCNGFNLICCGLTFAYLIVWFVWLQGIVVRTLNPPLGAVLFLSLSWIPLSLLQLLAGAIRYGSLSLQLKSAEEIAGAANQAFFVAIQHCVTDAVTRFHAAREMAEEKPTLQ